MLLSRDAHGAHGVHDAHGAHGSHDVVVRPAGVTAWLPLRRARRRRQLTRIVLAPPLLCGLLEQSELELANPEVLMA